MGERMKVVSEEKIICFDVDDTLVMHCSKDDSSHIIYDPSSGVAFSVRPHQFHINLLKQHAGRGYTIIVWSAGGYRWAETVLKELAIDNYVDIVMTKPTKYVDDLLCGEWMGEHLYFGDKVDG